MKKYTLTILAAILGSAITLAAVALFSQNKRIVQVEHLVGTPVQSALFTTDEEGEIIPLDFTTLSRELMDAVVHIRSTQEVKQSLPDYQQLPDPFREFFDEDFFRHYFQQPGQGNRPPQQRMGVGSGVIINSDGYIVTNDHVIANADEIEVTLHNNRTYQAKIIGTDPATDLALVQIKESGLPTIPLVNSDEVEVGEWVLAIGNPFNLNSTVTAGIISAKSRSINILRNQYAIESFLQTDAAINPGNSGGALVNLQGGLVGINTAIASPTGAFSGYGFAVPSNIVNKVISDLLEYGIVQRGYLGVTIRNITGSLADEEDLDVTQGVYIDSVLENSAADKAGIRPGDVITAVEGNELTMASELQERIGRQQPGDKVDVTINRDGKTRELTAVLQNRQGNTKVISKDEGKVLSMLGAEFETISKKEAEELDIPGGVRITKLYNGKIKRETDVEEGFIITSVNNQIVKTAEELIFILEKTRGGVFLEGIYDDIPGKHYYAFGL